MSASGFVVHVASIRKALGSRIEVSRRGVVEDLALSASCVPDGAECEAHVVIESVLGGVSVTGTVRAPWTGSCRRCLGPATGELFVEVSELYTPDGDGEETYLLSQDDVDLEILVHDAVLLELPPAPLCKSDCKGLCPRCGADLNNGDCKCRPEPDPRWAVLDQLR